MSKWIEYQPILEELKHEWCNKCNKTCPYNNCKIYRVMQILARQKPIPHDTEKEIYKKLLTEINEKWKSTKNIWPEDLEEIFCEYLKQWGIEK